MATDSVMDIRVEVGPLELTTIIGEDRVYDDEADHWDTRPITLGEAIAKKVYADLLRDPSYGEWRAEVVRRIRDDEIRAQVRPLIEKAIAGPIQRTTSYGQPVGEPTTLAELVWPTSKPSMGDTTQSGK